MYYKLQKSPEKVSETLDNLDKETMRKWVVTQRMGRGNGGYFPFAKDFMNKLSFDQTITHPFFFFLTQNDGLNGYTFCWLVLLVQRPNGGSAFQHLVF